jgi:hypothetical protein
VSVVSRSIAFKGLLGTILVAAALLAIPAVSLASTAWSVHGVAEPSEFVPAEGNRYQLLVMNTGDASSLEGSEGAQLIDRLPRGLQMVAIETEGAWECSQSEAAPEEWVVTCTFPEALEPGKYAPSLGINVSAPLESATPLENLVTVSGGGATVAATTSQHTSVGTAPQKFGFTDFSMEAHNANGEPETRAGGHPWQITTSLGFPWTFAPPNPNEEQLMQVENVKKVTVELPAGLVGNVLDTERCTQVKFSFGQCPKSSRVGSFAVAAGAFQTGGFRSTDNVSVTSVYNIASEPGYPAEFAIRYLQRSVFIYVSVVHTPQGERARFTTVGIPPLLETGNIVLTLWGEPGAFNESGSEAAFITNPTDCSAGPAVARVEAESWGNPGHPVAAETTIFQEITGCNELASLFKPTLQLAPLTGEAGTTQADSPSGFAGAGTVPHTTDFDEREVPEVRHVSVALPPGLSISPAAAQGLVGCQARGPEGINLGSTQIGPGGIDEGNPEATEYGAGHAGGNGSPYDDAQYHTAPGHCPAASTVGSVEVTTPLLEEPLHGHLFIAQPECGGEGLPACTTADAEDGTLFKSYLELAGEGVLIKLPATISVNQASGQLSLRLRELPQFPFSEVKVSVHGGPRAPLATPQTCGPATTSSLFTPWSAAGEGEAFAPAPSAFSVDADGAGGPCPPSWPFAPGFSGGSVSTNAGAFTDFTTTLTRNDREQNLTGLSVALPPGLLAKLAGVTPCPEPQASSGNCPVSSLIGHDTAAAGSGTEPFYVHGNVYLTAPYRGAPLGLSVVTAALAGPFDLGKIVVRAAIEVDPETAQVRIVSDPIPQSWFGIPLRLKTLNVAIDRNQFILNPTNCSPHQLAATMSGDRGASANPAVGFAVQGCSALAFKPKLSLKLSGKTKRTGHPALRAALTYPKGAYANIAKAQVTLPHSEFLDQAHIGTVCTRVQFAAGNGNGEQCPPASIYGHARAITPLLDNPIEGPVYLRSSSHKLPDLVAALNGQISVDLAGKVDTGKGGGIRNTFEVVPDAPVSKFVLSLKGGDKGLLVNSENICRKPQHAIADFTAQNGKVSNTTPAVQNSCKKNSKKHAKGVRHR